LLRAAAAAGVSICTFVLVKQVKCEPIAPLPNVYIWRARSVSICTFVPVKQVKLVRKALLRADAGVVVVEDALFYEWLS